MRSISATIITLNEEDRIREAIASLPFCDEVIVVDSGSSDRTRQVASASRARVIQRDWRGYSEQKNFAADQARHDWILSVDADERPTVELADQIVAWKQVPANVIAMSMPRRTFYLGAWIRHSGWYPNRKVRLYDRRRARWSGDFVHERLETLGPVGRFDADLLHFPYRDWRDHLQRIDRYSRLAAAEACAAGRRPNLLMLAAKPPLFFLKSFFLQAGLLDGWRGLAIACMGVRYVWLREWRIFSGQQRILVR